MKITLLTILLFKKICISDCLDNFIYFLFHFFIKLCWLFNAKFSEYTYISNMICKLIFLIKFFKQAFFLSFFCAQCNRFKHFYLIRIIQSTINHMLWFGFMSYPFLPNPSARTGYDTRSIFKRNLTGLNSEFSFS